MSRQVGKTTSGRLGAALVACAVIALTGSAQSVAAEPNDDFTTATGPLTAGQTFKANLETTTDADFQFFYVPDTVEISVTTINATEKRGGAADRGRTIVSSLLRARKSKLPLPVTSTVKPLRPGKRSTVTATLLPGKYFIPVGRATPSGTDPLPNVPFRLQIGPVGSTTDSYEIFESRCRAAQRRLDRIRSSIKRTSKRVAKAIRNDASPRKIVKLKLKLRDKRAKAAPAKKAEKFACSIPR